MAHQVYASMHSMEPPAPQTEIDRSSAEAQGAKLGAGHDPVLT